MHRTCRVEVNHGSSAELGLPFRRLFLVSGWACRARILANGERQILGFLVPGDCIDLSDDEDPPLHRTFALTRTVTINANILDLELDEFAHRHFGLRIALARSKRAETRRMFDHIVRLGAMPAMRAMGHLLAEFHDRLARPGEHSSERFLIPISQDTLGEALGLSSVHTNRVLSQLRAEGLLQLGPGWALLTDPIRLAEMVARPK